MKLNIKRIFPALLSILLLAGCGPETLLTPEASPLSPVSSLSKNAPGMVKLPEISGYEIKVIKTTGGNYAAVFDRIAGQKRTLYYISSDHRQN